MNQPKITKFWSTNARNFQKCPRCNAEPGEDCRTPSGRKSGVHADRMGALKDQQPEIYNASKLKEGAVNK